MQNFFGLQKSWKDRQSVGFFLNYGEVSHFITDFLQDHTYKLIESVAEQLAEAMLLSMPVLKGVEIELCKPHAQSGFHLKMCR